MRLKDILGGMDPSQFLPELLLPGKLTKFSGTFKSDWIISASRIEAYIKDPSSKQLLSRMYQGNYFPLIPHAIQEEYFYQSISSLHGSALWDAITKNDSSIHFRNIFEFWPELKSLSLDLFKYTPFGGQSYMVISHNVPVSSFGHHTDPMDLFAIQLYGSKKWKFALDNEGRPYRPVEPGVPYNPLDPDQKYLEVDVKPGDVVFVPFQMTHVVEQIGDEPSVHLVIGVTRNFKMQLNNYLNQLISHHIFDSQSPFELRDNNDLYEKDLKVFELKLKEFAEKFDHKEVLKSFLANSDAYNILRSKKG
jgi:hypothetical protein